MSSITNPAKPMSSITNPAKPMSIIIISLYKNVGPKPKKIPCTAAEDVETSSKFTSCNCRPSTFPLTTIFLCTNECNFGSFSASTVYKLRTFFCRKQDVLVQVLLFLVAEDVRELQQFQGLRFASWGHYGIDVTTPKLEGLRYSYHVMLCILYIYMYIYIYIYIYI
jgi:hypothetical protein